jgi:hypothetical protein
MKKWICFLTVCLLLAVLPVSALADTEVAAMVEALPTVEQFQAMDADAQLEAYNRTQAAYDAYMALSEEEKASAPKVTKGLLKRVFSYLKPYRGTMILVVVCILIGSLATALSSYSLDPLINNYIVIGIWLGAIFVGCSREPIEDEMISRIRLNALLVGLYLQAAFIITATFVFNSVDYLEVMMYNLVTYPLIFLAVYRWMLWRALKSYGDGE